MLRASGATRLTDILRLLEDWNPTTVDGFTWQMSPFGLDGHQTQAWVVMVDGLRVDIGQFGVSSLNRVPVNLSQIDSVEVLDLPQLHHGEFVDAGLIHIHTRGAGSPGFGGEGSVASGNPTGDPGPWRYTDEATPNVDKIGPDFWADARYRANVGSAARGEEPATEGRFVAGEAGYVQRRHYPTREGVRLRNLNMAAGDYPQINVYAPSARLQARLLGGDHHVYAGYSKFEDFFFFKPYGREIPVTTRFVVGGVNGVFGWGGGESDDSIRGGISDVAYRVVYSQNTIDYRRNSFDLNFDWEQNVLSVGLDAGITSSRRLRHRVGIGADYVWARTGYALTQDDFWLAKIYADTRVGWTPRVQQVIGVSLRGGGNEAAFNAMTSCGWQAADRVRLEATAAYVERLPEQDGRIWFWQERGYDFLPDAGVVVDADGRLGTARRWSVDVSVASPGPMRWPAPSGSPSPAGKGPSVPLRWRFDAYYRGFLDQFVESQRFEFDPVEWAFSGPVELLTGQGGDVVGCQGMVETGRIPHVRLRTVYRYQRWISGDDAFRNLWAAVPRHHFRQRVSYTPVPGFALWGQLNYTSSSEWLDYRDAAAQSGGSYTSRVDDFLTLDAAAEKWFWSRRLRGSLLFKDLFNQSPRYHPIGAALGLSAFIQVELMLGSVER
jgi:hypothetical protein